MEAPLRQVLHTLQILLQSTTRRTAPGAPFMQPTASFETFHDLGSLGWQHGPLLAMGTAVLAVALAALCRLRRQGRPQTLAGFFVAVGLVMQVMSGLAWWEAQGLVPALNDGHAVALALRG
jgi:hypothetical protein